MGIVLSTLILNLSQRLINIITHVFTSDNYQNELLATPNEKIPHCNFKSKYLASTTKPKLPVRPSAGGKIAEVINHETDGVKPEKM